MPLFHHPRHMHQYELGLKDETSVWYQASQNGVNARRWINNVIATTFCKKARYVKFFSAWREYVKRSKLVEARMKLLRIIFVKWNLFATECLQQQESLEKMSRILKRVQSKRLHHSLKCWLESAWMQRAFTGWKELSMDCMQFNTGIFILFQLSRTRLAFRRWHIYSTCKKKQREISHTIVSSTFLSWKKFIMSCNNEQEEKLRVSQMFFKLRCFKAYVS